MIIDTLILAKKFLGQSVSLDSFAKDLILI